MKTPTVNRRLYTTALQALESTFIVHVLQKIILDYLSDSQIHLFLIACNDFTICDQFATTINNLVERERG